MPSIHLEAPRPDPAEGDVVGREPGPELEVVRVGDQHVGLVDVDYIQSGINRPRYATLKGIMAAKKKEIATIERSSLGVSSTPTQHVERIYVPQKTKKTEFITGSAKEAAAKLLEKLRHEARVIG